MRAATSKHRDKSFRRRTALTIAVALTGVLWAAGAAFAQSATQEEAEETIDTRIMRNLLSGLGLKQGNEPGIDYHERSPLVVPPTRDLPPPQSANAAANPAWPKDPDVNRRRDPKRKVLNTGEALEEEMRPLRPDELRGQRSGGRSASASSNSKPETTGTTRGEQLSPNQLGFKGFNWNPKSWFDREGTVVPFVKEPERTTLTEPPAGLRTPSPKYEYGSKNRLEPTRENRPDPAVGRE